MVALLLMPILASLALRCMRLSMGLGAAFDPSGVVNQASAPFLGTTAYHEAHEPSRGKVLEVELGLVDHHVLYGDGSGL